jgi:endoglucanase
MNQTALSFLRELVAAPSPSGSEWSGQKIVADYMAQYADTVDVDVHGNVLGVLNPDAEYRVMLAGHCDEIGLMVQHIDDKGYIYVSAVGGVNVPLLSGERIVIQARRGPVPGVIGVKPIHLMTPKERESSAAKIHELWVDIGAKTRKDAEKVVELGDVATIDAGWIGMRNGLVACRGFDDRIGAFIVTDVLRVLKNRKLKVGLYVVSTVQEEVGLRGSRTAAFDVDPNVGIAVDVSFASDYPGVDPKMVSEIKLGKGPILSRGPTYNPEVFERLRKAARDAKIATQMQPGARGANTDAYSIMLTRGGVATGLVSVPTRYLHSPVETISLRDAEQVVKLLAGFVSGLNGSEKWGVRRHRRA